MMPELGSRIRAVWRETFPDSTGSDDENAFDLGADSLDCAQLVYRLEVELDTDIGGVAFLLDPTCGNLVALASAGNRESEAQ
jgi:acyl carrier protein